MQTRWLSQTSGRLAREDEHH